MEFALLGWPEDGPALDLDHRRFAYAGKFVMTSTGKAVAREDTVVGAVAFNRDRTHEGEWWIRYITVRGDRRGEGIGPRLADFAADEIEERGAHRVRIAVNNPFAYEALYKAGFAYTGEETGIAELVLARPGDRSPGRYRQGLDAFRGRGDLELEERSFLDGRTDPPERVRYRV